MIHPMAQVERRSSSSRRISLDLFLGIRDYIHVVDVAIGHIAAMNKFDENCGFRVRVEADLIDAEFVLV